LVRGYKTNNNKEKSTQSVSKTIELTDTGETQDCRDVVTPFGHKVSLPRNACVTI